MNTGTHLIPRSSSSICFATVPLEDKSKSMATDSENRSVLLSARREGPVSTTKTRLCSVVFSLDRSQ